MGGRNHYSVEYVGVVELEFGQLLGMRAFCTSLV